MTESGSDILVILIVSVGLTAVLVIGIVIFIVAYQRKVMRQKFEMQALETEYQKELMLANLQSQENERARIAKDLHDEIGAMLSAVKMNVNLVSRRLKQPGTETDPLAESRSMLDEAIVGVRRISHDLMPPALENLGLVTALTEFCKKISQTTGILMEFSPPPSLPTLPKETQLALFRICQEMTNNTLKHAEATQISLTLTVDQGKLTLIFSDNGKGFDVAAAKSSPSSLGLKSLESRSALLQGTLTLISHPSKGTQFKLIAPLPGHSLIEN